MRKYTSKPREIIDKCLDSIICDVCGKTIGTKDSGQLGKPYYKVFTHHSDWGNDSHESYKHFDLCSYDCLIKHQYEYFNKANGSEEYEISLEYAE